MLASRLRTTLENLHQKTRLRTWPALDSPTIAAVALPCDAAHVGLFLDAAETFHPGASVTIFADRPIESFVLDQAVREFQGLKAIQFQSASSASAAGTFDLAVILHPLPYHDPRFMEELQRARPVFNRIRARRRWMLQRNMELWDASWGARAWRRIVQWPIDVLRRLSLSAEQNALIGNVLSALPSALEWKGDRPCAHANAKKIFELPRQTWFCPDCGMGFTPPERASLAAQAPETYGAGYAQYHLYTGRREWARFIVESCDRVKGYLSAMGFDPGKVQGQGRVLDFGCGNARFAQLWLGHGWQYVGVDFSESNLEFARRQTAGKAEFLLAEIGSEELRRRGPFDFIFLSHVLEHVPDPVGLLESLRGLTAPGGSIYIEVPDAFHYTWNMVHRGFASVEHLWDFTPAMLRATAQAAGWSVQGAITDTAPKANPYQALLARNAM